MEPAVAPVISRGAAPRVSGIAGSFRPPRGLCWRRFGMRGCPRGIPCPRRAPRLLCEFFLRLSQGAFGFRESFLRLFEPLLCTAAASLASLRLRLAACDASFAICTADSAWAMRDFARFATPASDRGGDGEFVFFMRERSCHGLPGRPMGPMADALQVQMKSPVVIRDNRPSIFIRAGVRPSAGYPTELLLQEGAGGHGYAQGPIEAR